MAAGFQHIQKQALAIDFSSYFPEKKDMRRNYEMAMKLARSTILRFGGITEERFDSLYQQMLEETRGKTFSAISYFLRIWGYKNV